MSLSTTLVRAALAALPYPLAFRLARLVTVDHAGVAPHATLQCDDRARDAVQSLGGAWDGTTALPCAPSRSGSD